MNTQPFKFSNGTVETDYERDNREVDGISRYTTVRATFLNRLMFRVLEFHDTQPSFQVDKVVVELAAGIGDDDGQPFEQLSVRVYGRPLTKRNEPSRNIVFGGVMRMSFPKQTAVEIAGALDLSTVPDELAKQFTSHLGLGDANGNTHLHADLIGRQLAPKEESR